MQCISKCMHDAPLCFMHALTEHGVGVRSTDALMLQLQLHSGSGSGSSSSSTPLLCRAAQLLTDREMRGGDAGWGHKQGEAEEEKAVRESPALQHTATTRRSQRRRREKRTGAGRTGRRKRSTPRI